MNLTKEQKVEKAANLAEEFKAAGGVFFTAYQGLKFQELAELREKLSAADCSFHVERNSLLSHAVKGAGIKEVPEASILKGPTAMAVIKGGCDIVPAAKIMADFEKDCPALKMKACYSSETWFSVAECVSLSKLGTRAETLSHLAGSLYTSVSRIASVLQAPIRDLAYALKAVEEKKNSGAAAA